jgi:hypothetical protein
MVVVQILVVGEFLVRKVTHRAPQVKTVLWFEFYPIGMRTRLQFVHSKLRRKLPRTAEVIPCPLGLSVSFLMVIYDVAESFLTLTFPFVLIFCDRVMINGREASIPWLVSHYLADINIDSLFSQWQ